MIPASIHDILERALKAYAGADGARAARWLAAQPVEGLFEREIELVRLVAQGLSNQEIADAMTVEMRTARQSVCAILGRLGFKNRTQLAIWAIRRGIVVLESEDTDE